MKYKIWVLSQILTQVSVWYRATFSLELERQYIYCPSRQAYRTSQLVVEVLCHHDGHR